MISTLKVNELFEKYPSLFKEFKGGFIINEGWFKIISDLCEFLILCQKQSNKEILIYEVKNLYGTLYIEHNDSDFFVNELFKKAESLSYNTCEDCGGKGKLYSSNGYSFGELMNLCENDALKRLFKPVP